MLSKSLFLTFALESWNNILEINSLQKWILSLHIIYFNFRSTIGRNFCFVLKCFFRKFQRAHPPFVSPCWVFDSQSVKTESRICITRSTFPWKKCFALKEWANVIPKQILVWLCFAVIKNSVGYHVISSKSLETINIFQCCGTR